MTEHSEQMPNRNEVYAAIDSERAYQDARWGNTLSGDRPPTGEQSAGSRTVDEFALYIVGYAHKLLDSARTFAVKKDNLDIIRNVPGFCFYSKETYDAPTR